MPMLRDLFRKQFAVASDVIVHDVLGASWDKGTSPILTRTDSAVGLVANAGIDGAVVQNDFDNIPLFKAIHEVTDDLGNVFIRIPKLYIKKTDDVGAKTWQVCGTKRPGFYLPWCFWDFSNNCALPYIDVGKYPASLSAGNKLESKSGVFPLVSKNIVQFRDYAKANGAGYQQLDVHTVDVLRTLFFVEFATLNSQAIMNGYSAGQYSATHTAVIAEVGVSRIILANAQANLYEVGQGFSVGTSLGGNQICTDRTITGIDVYDASNKAITFDGAAVNIAIGNIAYNSGYKNGKTNGVAASSGSYLSNSSGKHSCKYRGIENPFGNVWQFVDGVNINEFQSWVAKNAAQYASNVFASPYEQLGYVNHNANGYVAEMGFDVNNPFAEIATSITGADADKYYCDYYYQSTGQRIAHFGGHWSYGSVDGLSVWVLNLSSGSASLNVGGRLLKKPL